MAEISSGYGMASSVVGAAGQFVEAWNQSENLKEQSAWRRQQAEINMTFANLQAEDALRRGDRMVDIHRKKVAQLLGTQRTAMAAQGIDIGSGSAADIQADTAYMGAKDELTLQNNAWQEAWGYRVQALGFKTDVGLANLAANSANATLLTGAARAANTLAGGIYQYARS